MNKLVRFYPDIDLRNNHLGLSGIAKEDGLDPKELKPGQFLVFLNSKKTAFKLYAANHVVAHYRAPSGRVDLRTLSLLPTYFNGSELDYSGALRKLLEKSLGAKGRG